MDFVSDALADGRQFRCFTIVVAVDGQVGLEMKQVLATTNGGIPVRVVRSTPI